MRSPVTDIDELLDQIHAALERDGYYVDPSLAGDFTDAQLATLAQRLADADQPTYVVAYPLRDNDEFGGNGADLLARLHSEHPDPGVYLTTTTRLTVTEYGSIDLEGRQYDVPGERDGSLSDYQVLSTVSYEEPPDLGTAFLRATELLNAEPQALQEAYDRAVDADRSETSSTGGQTGSDDPGSGDGFDPTGLIVAVLLLAALGALGWAAIRRLAARGRPQRGAGRSTPFVLPASAMERIRAAHDRRLTTEAEDELLALGVAVDRVEIAAADDRASWQAALDHYDGARRVLEHPDRDDGSDVLDVVGALVLARRGQDALAAARRGRAWTPAPTCYLNPLHGTATTRRVLDAGGGRLDAPLCTACRKDLQSGRAPDILDVAVEGTPVHYFETDVEPWASTGYGSLDGDLVAALHRGPR